ncbi:MAG TPA: CHAT domain-containing protein, partial [Terriglobales bacterium]|nr:CHAT domain-containing protein [Terriglobales bacterium]
LRIGASGYIGALWPVNDRVAALFAARFYQGMESELAATGGRARVSEVLTRTRRDVFRETGDPTALAYVFYGDPNLAFARVH